MIAVHGCLRCKEWDTCITVNFVKLTVDGEIVHIYSLTTNHACAPVVINPLNLIGQAFNFVVFVESLNSRYYSLAYFVLVHIPVGTTLAWAFLYYSQTDNYYYQITDNLIVLNLTNIRTQPCVLDMRIFSWWDSDENDNSLQPTLSYMLRLLIEKLQHNCS